MSFEVKNTQNYGNGLFSKVHFEPGQTILKFEGIKIPEKDLNPKEYMNVKITCLLQIGTDLYLDLENKKEFFINHSCNPNTGIKIIMNTAFLVALHPIKPGDQLFFDYATTSTDSLDTWKMDCRCGHYHCRKIISGFELLTPEQQKYYLDLNVVPNYIKKLHNV